MIHNETVHVMARGSAAVRAVMWGLVVIIAGLTGYILVQQGNFDPAPRVALVTADKDAYWDPVIEGAQAAATKRDIKLEIHRAEGSAKEQTELLERLVAEGYDGIAVSPVDAEKQAGSLRRIAQRVSLVTLDADSPLSKRLTFVGCDNYAAGRRCGSLVRQAMPEGGQVAIVIGSLDKSNGQQRRQGLIDELLDRSFNPDREPYPLDQPLTGEMFTIVGTYVDQADPEQARANAAGAIADHPDLDGLVGLYGYSTPAILHALREAGKLGELEVVGFDYNDQTIEGIEQGHVYGTIAQDQFNYGMRAVDILAVVTQSGPDAAPLSDTIHLPTVAVTRENLPEFMNGFINARSSAAAARLMSRQGG